MQKNTIKKSDTLLNDIIVDLGCKNANSNIGKWEINIEPPKRFWIFRKLGLNIKRKIRLYLGDIKADDLKIDANTLLYISLKNEEWAYGEKKDIDIDSLSVYFHIIINPLSILDCKYKQSENGDNRYPLSFNICMEDCSTGTPINTIPVTIFIRLTKKSVSPSVSIRLNSVKTEYHSGLKNEEIGILTISNDAKLNYNPYVTGKVKLLAYDTERNILVDNIYLKDANDDGYVNFGTLDSGKAKKYVIKANYPGIGNPASMSNKYELTAIYEDEKNTEICRSKADFTVERNSAKPQLLVSLQRNKQKDSIIYITNEKTVKWDDKVIDFSNEQNLLKHCFSFQVKNGCKNGLTNTGLVIEDVKCTPKLPILAKGKFYEEKTLDDIFGFSQPIPTILLADETKEYEVSFRQNDIIELFTCDGSNKDFNTSIEFIVSFKYWDCPDIQDTKKLPVSLQREFKFAVCMTLYQLPSVNWLAIDYGTSAIACRYAGKTLHLRDKKLKLWGVKEDAYENGTQYLSSNIIYRNNKTVDKSKSSLICDYEDRDELPNYKSLAIVLSPTVEQEDMNLGFILPCMKMLLGYDYIPNITQYEGYTYNHKSNGNICEQELFLVRDGRVIPSDLCKVNNVMYEVYKELFLYFVKDNIANPLQLNNIILTVPNTFSPNHFLQLRNIINESFKEYNIRNLKFISESDAVACYYYRNWATINRSQEVDRASFMDSLRKEERVLIFDMGAGTLDLTYLIKKDREIVVKGRMGISKAGNYLDGLLASIIAEENNVLHKICDSNQITDSDHLLAARELKNIIKSKLKPILGMSNATLTLSKSNRAFNDIGMKNDVVVRVDDIVDNPIFQDYLESCTIDILYNFFAFYNLINENNERRCVDTVIISGRASKLSFIKEKVNDCFDGFTDSLCFKTIDMSTVMESEDKSKDVVVEGAMAYALQDDMKIKYDNIMANYGILYYDCYGDLKYTEILNPRKCKPVASKIIEGMNINQYDTEETECDISGCNGNDRPLILLQSYSNNTLNDWKNGKREYITVMSEWRNLQGGTNSLIKIKVDENNQMRLYINNAFTDNLAPSHIDVNSELNQKSMWPFMQK